MRIILQHSHARIYQHQNLSLIADGLINCQLIVTLIVFKQGIGGTNIFDFTILATPFNFENIFISCAILELVAERKEPTFITNQQIITFVRQNCCIFHNSFLLFYNNLFLTIRFVSWSNQMKKDNPKWKILQKIGQGEHGMIYLIEYTKQGKKQLQALKRVTYSSKMCNDFQFSLLPKLNHPNIIKVMECNEIQHQSDGDHCFEIVLEFAANGDLQTYAKKKYNKTLIPQDKLIKWLCQICLALHYLHNQVRVLHRDIKAKNILVMGNELLKITDFGTARQLSKHQEFAMTSVGTPYYLSPQAVRGPKYNNKSDVWGLGCIMFELCTGKKPFQGSNLNDLIKQILSSQVQEIPDCYSEWFRNLIKAMLEKSPEKRPSIQNILQRSEIRQAFLQLKQQYEIEYKDLIYPVTDLKTKKYCERQQYSRVSFCSQSLKTVKNQKNVKLQIFQWKNQSKLKPKKEGKIADLSKFKNRSLKSIIQKRKSQKKDLQDLQKQSDKNSDS